MMARMSDFRLGMVQLLVGATMISFSPVFVKLADVGPTMAGFYRNLFGGMFLLVIVLTRGEKLWAGFRPFALASTCGVLFAADLTFWHRSIHYVGPGLATIIGNFQIFFLAAFGIAVFRERIDWKYLVSIPLAIFGLFLIVGIDWSRLESSYKIGVLCGVATAITYAAYLLVLQRSQWETRRLAAAANLCIISLVTAVVMGVEGRLQGESFHIPDWQSWSSLLAYGVICQAIGWMTISRALVKVEASRAGLILLLQPTLAFIWDILFFSRPTDIVDVAGASLALVAIYLGGSRERK
ncbi:MAG: DMT family transporter [Candidatus Latescibacterota bacterium]|nr:MAG: DMT family transporter [Candidatus Latescibacterota bacterium]